MQRASGLARLAERGCTARLATRILRRSSTQPASQLKFRPPATAFAPLEAARESDLPTYQNVDGMRHDDGRYSAFKADVRAMLGDDRVVDDPVRTFAYGTDASFYRLTPQAVVKVHSEQEVVDVMAVSRERQVPVTFRAAGTSLSGQAITDSVLLKLSHNGTAWRKYKIEDGGQTITLEPGLIGGEVNRLLAAYKKKHKCETQYKIGPDPASIESCMIGGIVANNSSGMCCGVAQNTYHTLRDMRVVLVDGTVLDTACADSRASFQQSHESLLAGLSELAARVQGDAALLGLIKEKYRIKNTTGYSINALADFSPDDPIEILKRIMIGSEGTLGFVSQVTYKTVPDHPYKASAFLVFSDIEEACDATSALRENTSVDAVEIFDRRSLRLAAENAEMRSLSPEIVGLPENEEAAALLIECRGADPAALAEQIESVISTLEASGTPVLTPDGYDPARFCHDPKDFNVYWDMRKGLIPIVGGARETGTSMLLEDVACATHKLGKMSKDLVAIFKKYGYNDACLMGHALEGNLHLIFNQSFKTQEDIKRFENLFEEICYNVAQKHGGSLKAEHGTGRNVAPFVEMEWGTKAYQLMWEVKRLFDPQFLLNPGVILNEDPDVHSKNIRLDFAANPIIDRCISCGWCESNCPSRDLSLTPRQRIQVYKELSRMREEFAASGDVTKPDRLVAFEKSWEYAENTCAADGMCQEKCPVKINTGELIKSLRHDTLEGLSDDTGVSPRAAAFATWLASPSVFGKVSQVTPWFLDVVSLTHKIIGSWPMSTIAGAVWGVSNNYMPLWNEYMPRGAKRLVVPPPAEVTSSRKRVVYLPSCVTRMMGPSRGDEAAGDDAVHTKFFSLLDKAEYDVIVPEGVDAMCCGMIFDSRGYRSAGATQASSLEETLLEVSENGKIPIVCDTSPCLQRMKEKFESPLLKLGLFEPVQFISLFLQKDLEFKKVRQSVAVHVPCSSKKLKLNEQMVGLAEKCAHEVHATPIPCCGMAGDRGMRYPELTGSSLQHLDGMMQEHNCSDGYSTSRTCEMSLSNHSDVHFRSLLYLIDEATEPKKAKGPAE